MWCGIFGNMASNPFPCRRRSAYLSLAVVLLTVPAGCSGFFKVTPEGAEPAPSTKPATTQAPPVVKEPSKPPATPPATPPVRTPPTPPTRRRGQPAPQPVAPAPTPVVAPVEPEPVEPPAVASDSAGIQRLVRVAHLWHTVALHHPYVATRGVAWDSALVRTLPTIRTASDPAAFAAAVSRLLTTLGDPLTRIERNANGSLNEHVNAAEHAEGRAAQPTDLSPPVRASVTGDGVLLLQLPPNAACNAADAETVTQAIGRSPTRVVIDLRAPTSADGATALVDLGNASSARRIARINAFVAATGLASALTTVALPTPSERVRRVGGAASPGHGEPFALGADAWLRGDAPPVPAAGRVTTRTVLLVSRGSIIPRALAALLEAGRASLVAEGTANDLDLDGSLVSSVQVPIAPGFAARIRTGALVHADGSVGLVADTVVAATAQLATTDTALGLRAALQLLRTDRAPRATRSAMTEMVPAMLPVAMDNQNYPGMGARLLAGFRLWSAMRARHAGRDLYDDDLDATFERVLPRLEAAQNEQQYAAAIGDLASTLDDAAGILRGPSFQTWLGTSTAPFRARLVEGRAIITDVVNDAATQTLALTVGTEIVAADGYPLPAWLSEHRRTGPASNDWTRQREQMRVIARGPEGTALFKLRDAAGKERSVDLPRRASYAAMLPTVQRPEAAASRMLTPNIGYIDVERFSTEGMDSVLQSMQRARGLVLDLRAWDPMADERTLANVATVMVAHLSTQPMFVQAREVRRYLSSPCLAPTLREAAALCPDERVQEPRYTMVDTSGHYQGRIVVLIDERTQGAMERLAMALESAASVTFIGSATAGAPSVAVPLELPGSLTVGIPLVELRRADGGQVQRVGISPFLDVRPTVRGVRNRQDEVLERAQQWLTQELDPPVRRRR